VRELALLVARAISPVEDDVERSEEDEDADISLGTFTVMPPSFHIYLDVVMQRRLIFHAPF